jgi:hypothetical protein
MINHIRKDNEKYNNNVMKNKISKFYFGTSRKIEWFSSFHILEKIQVAQFSFS